MASLYELAKVIRSKNSGPFEITLDVLFDSEYTYRKVKNSGVISVETICLLYHIEPEDIHHLVFYDQAMGFKITFAREVSSGTAGDRDVYGAQQHAPLMKIIVD